MTPITLSPLEYIKPDQIIYQYKDWIYFALVLTLFLSLSGTILRRHFEKAYLKPLIIAVSLSLTVAVFQKRVLLTKIFNSWGTLGSILLVFMLAIIPFSLAKGLGLSAKKSFWITYALTYILAWAHAPNIFIYLNNHGMALVGLLLLFAFVYAIWQSFHGILSRKDNKTVDQYNQPSISNNDSYKYPELAVAEKTEIKSQKIDPRQIQQGPKPSIQQLNQIDKLLAETSRLAVKNKKSPSNNYANQLLDRLKLILDQRNIVDTYLKHISSLIARMDTAKKQGVGKYGKNSHVTPKQVAILGQTMNELKYRLQQNATNFYSLLITIMRNIQNNKATDKLIYQINQARKLFKQIRTLMASLNDLEAKSRQLFLPL